MVKTYTGNPLLDEIIEKSHATLVYGPAGVGKTTLLIQIASNLCSVEECVYVSTEETLHYEWVSKWEDKFRKALFTETYDIDTLVKTSIALYMMEPKYIFVDSVNSLFRLEAMRESSLTKYTFILGLLVQTINKSGGKLFASAQVRAGAEGGFELPGESILQYYFDNILMMVFKDNEYRVIKPVKTPLSIDIDHVGFRITSHGVEWVYEH